MAPSTSSTNFPDTASTAPYLEAFASLRQTGWQLSELGIDELSAPPLLRGFLAADHPDGRSAIATAAVPSSDRGKERLFCRCAGRLIASIAAGAESHPAGNLWQPSPLSGVGWGLTPEEARRDSMINGVLGHRVLASWYGEGGAQVSEARPDGDAVFASYHRQRLAFAPTKIAGGTAEVATAGLVLWPEAPQPEKLKKVMVVGFGGGLDQATADAAAERAAIDRLAFLAAEQRLKRRPRYSAGRRYALEMMMHEDGENEVRAWLSRLAQGRAKESAPVAIPEAEDLGGPLGLSSFAVMKTAGAGLLPVVHGRGFPPYEGIRRAGGSSPAFHPFV